MKLPIIALLLLVIMLTIRPSLAQLDAENSPCWTRISNCLGNVTSPSDVLGCCPIIQTAIDNERDCFCLMSSTVQQNASLSSDVNTIFSFCGIIDTFDTLCSGSNYTSSSPADSSPPSPTLPPSDTTTTTPTPSPSPDGSSVLPCWQKIANCTSDSNCCAVFKEEIANEKECFCSVKGLLVKDPSIAQDISQLFNDCKVKGSFDKLCSGIPSSPRGSSLPSSLGSNNTRNGSGSSSRSITSSSSNKFSYSIGLLPTSILIIWAMF